MKQLCKRKTKIKNKFASRNRKVAPTFFFFQLSLRLQNTKKKQTFLSNDKPLKAFLSLPSHHQPFPLLSDLNNKNKKKRRKQPKQNKTKQNDRS